MPAQPATPLGLSPSFGFGDRTGLATPGHLAAYLDAGKNILPIFAQQSIREMTRTSRTPNNVMTDATSALTHVNYSGKHGADADHLKTPEDIDRTAAAGFTFFTIDPSGDVDPHADSYSPEQLAEKIQPLKSEISWLETYPGRSIKLNTGAKVNLTPEAVLRAAVKYGRAINRTIALANHIDAVHQKLARPYEIELSVDETPNPTTLAEHWIIAEQILNANVKLVSLAPRFIGDFEKGVDYKGNLQAFEKSLADHVAITDALGPYKLSLHSGSDKISLYPAFARITKNRFHVKTAGTSYLELLRVIARHDQPLFRELIDFARSRYDADKATYHVSAHLARIPAPKEISDPIQLEQLYLERWPDVTPGKGFTAPGRQILHCTFGSTLTHPALSTAIRQVAAAHPETYKEILRDHFARHLRALTMN